ncbi:MAG: FkbM family methyltransferase, partial [uncultured bacterium]
VTGCPLFTLDKFLADQPELPFPTHLKIDVDGPEVKILKGATATLSNPKLKHILVELFEDEETEVIELLSSFGFKKIKMKSHTPIPGPRGHMGNFIFRRQ